MGSDEAPGLLSASPRWRASWNLKATNLYKYAFRIPVTLAEIRPHLRHARRIRCGGGSLGVITTSIRYDRQIIILLVLICTCCAAAGREDLIKYRYFVGGQLQR